MPRLQEWDMPAVENRVSVESLGALERRLTFSLPADRLESQVGGRLREIARGAKIKGFRPGKVPAKVIEQRFGPQVRAEVLDGLLREGFSSAVRQESLQIAGNPQIVPAADQELAYVATFEVLTDSGDDQHACGRDERRDEAAEHEYADHRYDVWAAAEPGCRPIRCPLAQISVRRSEKRIGSGIGFSCDARLPVAPRHAVPCRAAIPLTRTRRA